MSERAKYRVIPPDKPAISLAPLTTEERRTAWNSAKKKVYPTLGCIGIFLLCPLCFLIDLAVSESAPRLVEPLLLLGSIIVFIMIGYVVCTLIASSKYYPQNLRELEQDKVRAYEDSVRAYEHSVQEVDALSSRLVTILGSSSMLEGELVSVLNKASEYLQQARAEYNDNAFGPFWDAIEGTMHWLALFNDDVLCLSRNVQDYYTALNRQKHTFPPFSVNIKTLPDPWPITKELHRLIRMGQRNYHFAMIWEQRKTREVLLSGFRTLEDAMNNLGVTVESSMSYLQSALSSDLAQLAEEEIRTRETIDEHAREIRDALKTKDA